jgi:tRNA threonylcarbamoyladenosine biosynthesis protein TsaE
MTSGTAGGGLELPTVDDTRDLGRRLAAVLAAGDLIVLSGPLGAGKTALTQGIGAGLRVAGEVTSPTFVISRVHPPDRARGGRLPLVHADAYRLGGIAEVDDLDLDASVDEAVTVVEWGSGKVEQLADAFLEVRMHRRDDEVRVVELRPHGGDWAHRLARLRPEDPPAGPRPPA